MSHANARRDTCAGPPDDAPILRQTCLDLMRELGPMSADQCAYVLGLSVLAIRPRFSELNANGQIEDSGKRTTNDSGKRAIVWQVRAATPPASSLPRFITEGNPAHVG